MTWFNRSRRYNDLSVSIREHLDDKIEELVEGGMSRKDAERAARREFGNVTLLEERSREVWQWPTLESTWADIEFAVQQLMKAPGFTATAVTTLALGIAVNATIFSLVSAFLLPQLPGREPQNVVVLSSVNPNGGFPPDSDPESVPNYLSWRTNKRLFQDVAAADQYRSGSLSGQGRPETVRFAAVSANYFDVFGVAPQLGRSFLRGEDRSGRDHVVILGYNLWSGRFGSDPAVAGRTIRLNREPYTVIGVMPKDFRLFGFVPQLWTPLVLNPADQTPAGRGHRFLFLFARLAPGVTLDSARAEMVAAGKRLQAEFPETEKRWGVAVRSLGDFLIHSFGIRTALAVMMTTVAFVLLIACANVAGLLLTRASGRRKELAIRFSLGASRSRIVRQLLTEGIVIALLGGGAGLLLTFLGIDLLRAGLTFNDAINDVPIALDSRVLLFAVAVSLLSAALSSLVPAFKSARGDTNTDLKSESRASSAGRSHGRLRALLVTGEVALALFLLIGTSLLIRAVFLIDHQQLGFRTDRLLTARIGLDQAHYPDAPHQRLFAHALISRVQQMPGVKDVSLASDLPATGGNRVAFAFEGEAKPEGSDRRSVLDSVVTPSYFSLAGIPALLGLTFNEADRDNAPAVVVVNQEFVNRYRHDKSALGYHIKVGDATTWSQVVGVVSDVKTYSENPRVDPEVYECFWQRPVGTFSVMLRSNVEPSALISDLRKAVASLDPELPLAGAMSMQSVIENQRNGNPLFVDILGTFAAMALMLAAIGIYGLIAYSVSQRTQEIGIRMAVGAKTSHILQMILTQGIKTTAVGAAIGFLAAVPLPKLFDSIFEGLHSGAPQLYVAVLAAILMVAAVATLIPALRATRVDPKTALWNQ